MGVALVGVELEEAGRKSVTIRSSVLPKKALHRLDLSVLDGANEMDRIKQLLQLYEDDKSDPFTLFALGFEYHKQGRLEDALKWYKSILATAPGYTGVYYHLGKLYLELGNRDHAVRTYQEGIQVCNDLQEVKDRSELQQALMEVDDD